MPDHPVCLPMADECRPLRHLKLNDTTRIKSHFVSYAPRKAYPIITGDYAERGSTIMYKRASVKTVAEHRHQLYCFPVFAG